MPSNVRLLLLFFIEGSLWVFAGYALGRSMGLIAGLMLGLGFFFLLPWIVHPWIIRQLRAERLREEDAPDHFAILKEWSEYFHLPVPELYAVPSAAHNLMTVSGGRKSAFIVTSALGDEFTVDEMRTLFAAGFLLIRKGEARLSGFIFALNEIRMSMIGLLDTLFLIGGEKKESREANPLLFLAKAVLLPFSALIARLSLSSSGFQEILKRAASLSGDPFLRIETMIRMQTVGSRYFLRSIPLSLVHAWFFFPLPDKGWARLFKRPSQGFFKEEIPGIGNARVFLKPERGSVDTLR